MTCLPQTIIPRKTNRFVLQGQKTRSRKARPEEAIQIAIVQYLEYALPPEFVIHHSRNGGVSKGENGRAKAMGTKEGFPDITIYGFDRLVVQMEVKRKGTYPNPNQRKMHGKLKTLGHGVYVVRSLEDVYEALTKNERLILKARPSEYENVAGQIIDNPLLTRG